MHLITKTVCKESTTCFTSLQSRVAACEQVEASSTIKFDMASPDKTAGGYRFFFNLSRATREEEVRSRPDILEFLAANGLSVDAFLDYMESESERLGAAASAANRPPAAETLQEESRREIVEKLKDYAAATANEAILAAKAYDDAEVAFRKGATLAPQSVLEIQRRRPDGTMTTPTVISSGSACVVVSLEHAHKGLRAPPGYYSAVGEGIKTRAKSMTPTTDAPTPKEARTAATHTETQETEPNTEAGTD